MKKKIISINVWLVMLCVGLVALVQSCKKESHSLSSSGFKGKFGMHALSAASDSALRAYKSSAHQLMVGYYRTWGDSLVSSTAGAPSMMDMPDSVDILCNFANYTPSSSPYWNALRTQYIPTLHNKGTKIVNTTSLPNTSDTSYSNHYANNSSGYAAWAQATYNNYVYWGYDGIDLDVESNPTGSTLNADVGLVNALSQYFGPKSTTGKLLVYDTNQQGSNNLFTKVYTDISYVFFQAYWQQTSYLTSTFNSYASYISPGKFIPLVDFEDGSGDGQNSNYNYNPVQIYQWAAWQPTQGLKGGCGSYGIDNEYFLKSTSGEHNIYTRTATSLMNPPAAPGIVSGATYQLVTALNNSSVLDVAGGGTTAGTKVDLWSNTGGTNQKWVVTYVGNGYYTLSPVNAPSMLLDVTGGSNVNGTQIEIWTNNGGSNNQKWAITTKDGGLHYSLSPLNARLTSLDVYQSLIANGTKIEIWTTNGGNNQSWQLVKQ